MIGTLTQNLQGVGSSIDREALQRVLRPIADRKSCTNLLTAGLVIKAGGGVLAKIGAAAYYGLVQGKLVTVAASTDMPALVGVITAAKFNVFCFFIDSASVVTVAMGTEGAAIENIVFPKIPEGKTMLGFLLVTHSATFTGNTTALDTATTVYFSPLGSFDPTLLL